jgi:AraC-like DNA-binding protein
VAHRAEARATSAARSSIKKRQTTGAGNRAGLYVLELMGYTIRADRVESLCDGQVPPTIQPFLSPSIDRSLVIESPVSPTLRRLAVSTFSHRFIGPLRAVFLEGVALQLFAIQSSFVAETPRRVKDASLSVRQKAAIHEARELLIADMRNPPTAASLAAAVGVSERALSSGFKVLFGGTIFEVLRDERLEHARIVLETENLPLKFGADRIGYRHL